MKISFRVVETSQKGQSLLQWNPKPDNPRSANYHSLQMPTEVAQYIMETCNARPVVLQLLGEAQEHLIDEPSGTGEKIGAFLKSFWR